MIIDAKQNKEYLDLTIGELFNEEFYYKGKVTSVLIINASDDDANKRYIEQKKKLLYHFGIKCKVKTFDEDCGILDIQNYICDKQDTFTAVMIQSPVYTHLDYEELLSVIDYKKDIDGLHPMNQGLLYSKNPNAIIPCTAVGVFKLLENNKIDTWNKKVVIVGRGKLVADPLSELLENHNCTVTKIHTKTDSEYSKLLIKSADIIISCAGKDLSDNINPKTVGDNLLALVGVGFRYENGKQRQDFDINDNWDDDIKITSDVGATGTATVCALVDNLLQIKYR